MHTERFNSQSRWPWRPVLSHLICQWTLIQILYSTYRFGTQMRFMKQYVIWNTYDNDVEKYRYICRIYEGNQCHTTKYSLFVLHNKASSVSTQRNRWTAVKTVGRRHTTVPQRAVEPMKIPTYSLWNGWNHSRLLDRWTNIKGLWQSITQWGLCGAEGTVKQNRSQLN